MSSKLALIAIAGLTISAVSLSAAAMVGGKELRDRGFDIWNWDDKPRCNFNDNGTSTTRSFDWHGGNSVSIDIPGEVHYRAGTGDKVVVTGPSQILAHIRIEDGDIEFDCNSRRRGDDLSVALPGRNFKSFGIKGDARLTLENLNQDDLELAIAGAGRVEASGKVEDLELSLIGASKARMGSLAVTRVELNIIGAGEADIAPKDNADINIVGAGTVRLMTEPKELSNNSVGAGRIIHVTRDKTPD